LRTLGCEHWQAEEILQEAFLRLLAARQEDLAVQDVRAWVFRVARNQWIDSRRELQRYWTDLPAGTSTADGKYRDRRPDPEQQLIRDEQVRRIFQEVSALPDLQRECIRLRAKGLRYREIAAVLGISLSAAVDHVRRSMAKLRRSLRVPP
jgi:RNA polymerase sigma-70 factor (ECF subfamily)